ncbi:MAG: cyclopropane-fatty-acyl-phospholipid synthase family protein [Vicinamibacteria bacterium]
MLSSFLKKQVLNGLENFEGGTLDLTLADGSIRSLGQGTPRFTIDIRDDAFFKKFALGGDLGLGESYMDGDWSTDNLPGLMSAALLARETLPLDTPLSLAINTVNDAWHWTRKNTRIGAKRNIEAHYDLSNDFFQTFLDRSMTYSCGYFADNTISLEASQDAKLRRLADKLDIRPGMNILEIGCGWGSLSLLLAREYGCKVKGLTLSKRQHELASERVATAGLTGQIDIALEDFRDTTGQFDRIVSVEMFEALGYENWTVFFAKCHELLAPNGTIGLQIITIPDHRFEQYRKHCDWLQKYIFPGSLLGSVHHMTGAMIEKTPLMVHHLEDIGIHYERTLLMWRARFFQNLDAVRNLGFDERFIRMWDYYLSVCAAAFGTRTLSTVQLVLTRPCNVSLPEIAASRKRAA